MAIMAASFLDNSQRAPMKRNSIGQVPPSPSPNYHPPGTPNRNMAAGTMSAPPTPGQTHGVRLSMYSPLVSHENTLDQGSGHGSFNMSSNHGSINVGSNHGSLNGGSSHASPALPHGAPRRVIMQQHHKAASSKAVLMRAPLTQNSLLTPQPHGRRRSLVGFDPMLADNTAPTATPSQNRGLVHEFASAPTVRRTISPKASGGSPPSVPFSFDSSLRRDARPVTPPEQPQPTRHSLTPNEKSSKPMVTKPRKQHRKGVQSFCVSDLRSISQDAMDAELQAEKEADAAKQTSAKSPKGSVEKEKTSPKSSPKADPKTKTPKKEIMNTGPKKEIAAPVLKKDSDSPKQSPKSDEGKSSKKDKSTSVTPPRSRKIPFLKKGHRRTRSLESKEILPPAKKGVEGGKRSSVPTTPASERKPSMYPGVVQDLMEIKFNNLQIPSLAKPSPTSFLTGKEDEVVRTCELEPAPHQMEIPTLPEFVVAARLNEFVENYRRVDQNFDLEQWVGKSRMDLRQTKIQEHRPIARSLLECGDNVCLQGVISKGTIADDRQECVVFEGQRQFMAVFRGTTEQQTKLSTKAKKKTCPLDKEHPDVEVYQCFLDEYIKLEPECFALLDKLTEENPFCDVVFSGHSFGAAMATLAAFRYSNARPMMRVSCLTLASPKVGFSIFRNMVNSQPNLKVMRLEFGQDGKCQLPGTGGSHVGHTLVLHGSLGNNSLKTNQPVLAYKFEVPKHKKFKTTYPDLRSYVTALEEVARLNLPWAQDFVGTSGQGVVVNNEARQVV